MLGVAISNLGDIVTARRKSGTGVEILDITGADIPIEAEKNTAGIAALKVLKRLDAHQGVTLKIRKGIPVSSGLGSSAASAVAGGFAANRVFGDILTRQELLEICTEAEAEVSGGYFANNTAPALFGGGTITCSMAPLRVIALGGLPGVTLVIVTPDMELTTRAARKVLPKKVALEDCVRNMANSSAIVAAFMKKDPALFARSVSDVLVEPARAKLIPGFEDVKNAAMARGALGCSISGSGPTVFAAVLTDGPADRIGEAMKKAFKKNGLESHVQLCSVDRKGTREIES